MLRMHKRERTFLRKGALLALSFLLMALAFLPAGSVQAADNKWIKQVWSKYEAYNTKTVDAYDSYMLQLTNKYNTYLKGQNDQLAELESIVLEDQKKWNEKFAADLAELKKRYEGNRDLRSALNDFDRAINPNSLSSAMGLYTRAADRSLLNSTMGIYDRAIDDSVISSYMAEYKKATNPNSIGSSAYSLHKTVSDNFISSPMYELMKSSSTNYVSSPVFDYSRGKISKAKAQKQYSKLYQQYTAQISRDMAKYKQEISRTAQTSELNIQALYLKTVSALETQRNETLQSISDLRKKISGEGLTWEPLLVAPVEGVKASGK